MASEELKKQLLKSAEVLTESALDQLVEIARVYAASTESTVDDTVVAAVQMLKKSFIEDLLDKIDGEEG